MELLMSWLTLAYRHLPGVTVISLHGDLDATNAGRLETFVADVRRQPGDHLVLDMAGVRFMDSAGLRALLSSYSTTARHGGSVRLAAMQAMPARIVEITRVGSHLPVHETVDDALTAVLDPPEPPRRPVHGTGNGGTGVA
ncbi:anti-anti-sigma factor [Nonomuraea muscovyensis]|uniref:Anti-sigma factor antagonist n=1 Tax=Nonomuraea muscovyensis TaxID=1124761 RepID=A0A7X0BZ95_9ACTN|nr:STAS domain-containing protein [Nonomuraea muscovyensis]MBB6345672.1 anti-anti-sigma factor [Nonomuraea muscovyensis]